MDDCMTELGETQREFEKLLGNVKRIKTKIMPKLEHLDQQIPKNKGYAKIVKENVNTALNIMSVSRKRANNIMLATDIEARTMEAYGE